MGEETRLIPQWAATTWASLSEPISSRSWDMGLNLKTFWVMGLQLIHPFKKKSCHKKYSSKENSCQGEKAMHKQMKLLYIQLNRKQHIFFYLQGYLCEMNRCSWQEARLPIASGDGLANHHLKSEARFLLSEIKIYRGS